MMTGVSFLSLGEQRRILVHAATLLNIPNRDNLHGHFNGLEMFDERLLQGKCLAEVPFFLGGVSVPPAQPQTRRATSPVPVGISLWLSLAKCF